MALYTQFQDPGRYYAERDERRDEKLRSAMSMMMQMKMYEREQEQLRFQNERALKREEISQQRANAYDEAVRKSSAREETQWQARMAIAKMRWPNDPDKQQRYLLGEKAEDIDWTWDKGYSEENLKTLAEYAQTDPEILKTWRRDDMDNLVSRYKASIYQTPAAVYAERDTYNNDEANVTRTLSILKDERENMAKAKADLEKAFAKPRSKKEMEQFDANWEAINSNFGIAQDIAGKLSRYPGIPLGEGDRRRLQQAIDFIKAYRDGSYWWHSQAAKDALTKKEVPDASLSPEEKKKATPPDNPIVAEAKKYYDAVKGVIKGVGDTFSGKSATVQEPLTIAAAQQKARDMKIPFSQIPVHHDANVGMRVAIFPDGNFPLIEPRLKLTE